MEVSSILEQQLSHDIHLKGFSREWKFLDFRLRFVGVMGEGSSVRGQFLSFTVDYMSNLRWLQEILILILSLGLSQADQN